MVGQKLASPFILAPVGLLGMQHGDGEILAARAANEAGIPFTLSTMSICSIEDVAEATRKPFWFQLYVIKDRGFSKDLLGARQGGEMQRAGAHRRSAGARPAPPRHQNGMTVPPEIRIKNIIDIATKPAWAWSVLKGKRKTFGNLAGHVKGMENVNSLAQWTNSQFDPALSWKDVEWIKSIWPGKLILKGILDADDARTAVKLGADAIVVSNHGGRQLDGAPSSISALPPIADAVGSDIEVLFDGGIRTGADAMRALALGARACMIGRAYAFGLGAGGQAGVAKAIDILVEGTQRHHGAHRHQQDVRDRRPCASSAAGRRRRRRGSRRAERQLTSSSVAPFSVHSRESGHRAFKELGPRFRGDEGRRLTASPAPARRA